ncbi:MAG: alkyl hydroperoxide reductase/Thiol specific antioxidant/Mal allergen [Gemmatimonadetes bacterium]|nr:alkyl hydroperoxide reductase/Thiol specific antioxidant/Mal allergen [Gemmatimonadota bacterium]
MPLKKGDPAPDVTLPSSTGGQVSLASLWKEQPLVVLFFPLAFTSTCTKELCTVGDDLGAYTSLGGQVVAVSVDSPFVLDRFRKETGAGYAFLSDFNRKASEGFRVLRDGAIGPGLLGASDRAAFVVGRDGRVAYAWHDTNPGLLPPFDEIKAALEALKAAA